jgi:hypothetical protein
MFLKVTNTRIYTNRKEIKQEISYSLHITWLPMWFHMHNYHVKVKHYDQIIIKLWNLINK